MQGAGNIQAGGARLWRIALALACALGIAGMLSGCFSTAVDGNGEYFALKEQASYSIEAELSGGSGRASIESPATMVYEGDGLYTVRILWSSSNYDKMTVDGIDYPPITTDPGSTFEIPLQEGTAELTVSAETTAMSSPHTIDYAIRFDWASVRPLSESDDASDDKADDAASTSTAASVASFRNTDLGCGWASTGSLSLSYAQNFTVDYFEGGYALVCISNGERFLVAPEGASAPDGLAADIQIIAQPANKTYLVASNSICLVDAIGATDSIVMSGTQASEVASDAFRQAMEEGLIAYGGKYNAPDYEQIAASGANLAIENMMITHSPEVKEKLQKLGLSVLTEQSSDEPYALGRLEWIKLYGVLFGKLDEACAIFDEQARDVEAIGTEKATGTSVAFFYINANGAAVTRRSGDYVAQMIELAGGRYALADDAGKTGAAGYSVTMEMESFFAAAKDADVIIYNATIDDSLASLAELEAKNALISQFKATRDGQVWACSADMYQQMTSTAQIVEELHAIVSGSAGEGNDLQFFRKLG